MRHITTGHQREGKIPDAHVAHTAALWPSKCKNLVFETVPRGTCDGLRLGEQFSNDATHNPQETRSPKTKGSQETPEQKTHSNRCGPGAWTADTDTLHLGPYQALRGRTCDQESPHTCKLAGTSHARAEVLTGSVESDKRVVIEGEGTLSHHILCGLRIIVCLSLILAEGTSGEIDTMGR
jgi:hypothetical protein